MVSVNRLLSTQKIPLPHQHDFLFTSGGKCLLANGRLSTLTPTVESLTDQHSTFTHRLRDWFTDAQKAGIRHPIAVGAIPFDKRQPAELYIPENYQWLADAPLADASVSHCLKGECHYHPEQAQFCQMVDSAVRQIQAGQLDKIVLARLLHINTDHEIDTLQLWQQLNQRNPHSYNFHLSLACGTLIGASPELLLRKQGDAIFSTPLAGSARRAAEEQHDIAQRTALVNSVKDRHEHALVTESIQRRLTTWCRTLTIPEPELFSTPTLWHLATRVSGKLHQADENALTLAAALHPTPALCGVPYHAARAAISELEPFGRKWFGGIVGWCDAEGNGEWVVVIRCGHVRAQNITLFAGAGIVAASQAESEWQETSIKLNTMLQAIGFVDSTRQI